MADVHVSWTVCGLLLVVYVTVYIHVCLREYFMLLVIMILVYNYNRYYCKNTLNYSIMHVHV